MKLELYQIDAFTDTLFGGNPACVVPLTTWLPDEVLLNIARENGVAETAFFIDEGDSIRLRWFTPEIEMDLCGHATLATAHVLKAILGRQDDRFVFRTQSGDLTVETEAGRYILNFPSRVPLPAELPDTIARSLSIAPQEVLKSRDYLLVYESEKEIRDMEVNRQLFDRINLDPGGVIVTAPGKEVDFVSRFFTPQASQLEDPVTGSAHCSLIPYWSGVLQKKALNAVQLSARGGRLYCIDDGARVRISGAAKTYATGYLHLD